MSKGKQGKDELTAIEDVFEKNLGSFDKLVSQSDANEQLKKVKEKGQISKIKALAQLKNKKEKPDKAVIKSNSTSEMKNMKKPHPVGAAQTKNVKFIPAESPKALAQKKKKLLHIPKVQP